MERVNVVLLLGGFLLLLLSSIFRVRMFARLGSDQVFNDLTLGTYATTFTDFLSFTLFRERAKLPEESKRTVLWFIACHWIGGVLFASALIGHLLSS
jgi:hypothetical protein